MSGACRPKLKLLEQCYDFVAQAAACPLRSTRAMQPWALVTPASRGIGLELARRLLQTTQVPVIATSRGNLDQTREHLLHGLDNVNKDRLHVLRLDVLGMMLVSPQSYELEFLIVEQTNTLSPPPQTKHSSSSQRKRRISTSRYALQVYCSPRSHPHRLATMMHSSPSAPTPSGP